MDIEIRTSMPAGSPILAYGTSSSFPGSERYFKAYALGALLLTLAILLISTSLISLPIPKDPLIIAIVPAKTRLPKNVPALWQTSLDNSLFPVLLGASVKDRKLVPFTASIELWAQKGLGVSRHGPFIVRMLENDIPTQKWPAFDLLRGTIGRDLGRLLVRPSVLGIDIPDIDGKLTNDGWLTSLPVQAPSASLPPGDMALDVSALPGAFVPIELALRGEGFQLPADLPLPRAVAWQWHSATSSGLLLDFSSPLTSTTTAFLQHVAQPSTRVYALQDGTIMQEFTTTGSVPTTGTAPFGTGQEDGLAWRSPGYDNNQTNGIICQHGSAILRLRKIALDHIQTLSSIPLGLKDIEVASFNGNLLVCTDFE